MHKVKLHLSIKNIRRFTLLYNKSKHETISRFREHADEPPLSIKAVLVKQTTDVLSVPVFGDVGKLKVF